MCSVVMNLQSVPFAGLSRQFKTHSDEWVFLLGNGFVD